MTRAPLWAVLVALPSPALAHDAFGDLGPFYASLLHPMADPMQATLVLGTAAFLAGRTLDMVRRALPIFLASAALSFLILGWRLGVQVPPMLSALTAIAVGTAAMLPQRWPPLSVGLALILGAGAVVGLLPDRPMGEDVLQPILGTLLGIAMFVLMAWAMFDAIARRLSRLVPAVAGSWVTAVGLLAGAFSFQQGTGDATGVVTSPDAGAEAVAVDGTDP